jgi:hypothetical protein
MDRDEIAKKILEAFGAQPHQINQTMRESKEIEEAEAELLRYGREIMDLHGQKLMWSFARGLAECFIHEIEHDKHFEDKIALVLKTIHAVVHIDLLRERKQPID